MLLYFKFKVPKDKSNNIIVECNEIVVFDSQTGLQKISKLYNFEYSDYYVN